MNVVEAAASREACERVPLAEAPEGLAPLRLRGAITAATAHRVRELIGIVSRVLKQSGTVTAFRVWNAQGA